MIPRKLIITVVANMQCLLCCFAQTFSSFTSEPIPDDNTVNCFQVSVSGLPAQIDTNFGITSCCINITHTNDEDLIIKLHAPDFYYSTLLSVLNGGSGDNYTNTCFAMNGIDGFISDGLPPFTGTFVPEQTLNVLNTSVNPNGIWKLCIQDVTPGDSGTLDSFNITFGNNPPSDPIGANYPCSFNNALACKCPDSNLTDCDLLPDIVNSSLAIQDEYFEYPDSILLSNATSNIGSGPLEIIGIDSCFCDTVSVPCTTTLCPDSSYPKQLVKQRIYHKNNDTMNYYELLAGKMGFHDAHSHMHVDNWVHNSLRIKGVDPDPSTWPMIGEGTKVSFCLINEHDCTSKFGYCVNENGDTLTLDSIPNSAFGLKTGCGAEQGIFPGMLDNYRYMLPGQEIYLPSGTCNGNYYIVSIVDPDNIFKETNDSNNVAVAPITLTQQTPNCCKANFGFYNTLFNPLQIQFIDSTVPIPDNWYWDFGDGNTSAQQFPIHTYDSMGVYTVTLQTNSNIGCGDSLAIPINVTTYIKDTKQNRNQIKIYPNPFSNSVTIIFDNKKRKEAALKLYNSIGQLVLQIDYITTGEIKIEKNRLKNGIYFFNLLKDNEFVGQGKIIIE